jgi:poly(3-hydroxybutyrate) depolymerase
MRHNTSLRFLGIIGLWLGAQGASIAGVLHRETGFLDRAVTVRGVQYRYQVYVPGGYDPSRAWPIILALHGGGEYGSDGLLPTVGALALSSNDHFGHDSDR